MPQLLPTYIEYVTPPPPPGSLHRAVTASLWAIPTPICPTCNDGTVHQGDRSNQQAVGCVKGTPGREKGGGGVQICQGVCVCPTLKNMGHFLGKMGVKYAALLNVGKNVCLILIMLCIEHFQTPNTPIRAFHTRVGLPWWGGGGHLSGRICKKMSKKTHVSLLLIAPEIDMQFVLRVTVRHCDI